MRFVALAIGPATVHAFLDPYLAPVASGWWRIAMWTLPCAITAYWLLHVRPDVID